MNSFWLSSSKQVYFFVLVPRDCMTKLRKNLHQQRSLHDAYQFFHDGAVPCSVVHFKVTSYLITVFRHFVSLQKKKKNRHTPKKTPQPTQ